MTDPKTVAAIREAAETAAVCDFSHRCGKKWPTSPAYWCVGCLLAGQSAALDALQREHEAAWDFIANGWDIEDRAYFERDAPQNGFRYPLVQAIHHIWKRDPKVQQLEAEVAQLRQERDDARKDAAYHSDCRPNRKQAEAAIADAKATHDRWADEVKARREAEAQLATAREALEKLGWMETAQEALAALAPAPKQED